jgi:CRP-like cAMP-binding protein
MIWVIMLPEPFDRLAEQAVIRRPVKQSALVFGQGDAARGMIFVLSGRVALIRHTESGHQVTLHVAAAGETAAEASLFSPAYHCDCVAVEDSQVMLLKKAAVLALIESDPVFSKSLMQRFAAQIIAYRRRLELLAIPGAEDRVLAALADGWLTGSVMQFAATIGLSHEATYRALSRLVAKGLVARPARGRYVLT